MPLRSEETLSGSAVSREESPACGPALGWINLRGARHPTAAASNSDALRGPMRGPSGVLRIRNLRKIFASLPLSVTSPGSWGTADLPREDACQMALIGESTRRGNFAEGRIAVVDEALCQGDATVQ